MNKNLIEQCNKLAQKEDADAQFKLALMYYKGEGVSENKEKAVEWLKKSAEQGHGRAQNKLAYMYYNGEVVPENKEKAVEWYTKSAEQGNSNSQYNLSIMYNSGEGVAKDKEKAVEWLKKSAAQGYAIAQNYLARIYDNGKAKLKKDPISEINYIDEYDKYWIYEDGVKYRNPKFYDKNGRLILALKKGEKSGINFYKGKLIEIFNYMDMKDSWVTIVPSSKQDVLNEGMCELINRVVSQLKDVRFHKCLNRKKTIEKLATGGNRSIKTHLDSIELCGNRNAYDDKKIYLVDDIMTSGNSLLGCKKILEDAGAEVICIALGKTSDASDVLNQQESDEIYIYNLDKEIQKILYNQEYQEPDNHVKHIIEKYEKCKSKFNKYEKLISNNNELRNRRREVYLYLIKQLTYLQSIDEYYCERIPYEKLYVLKMILYRDLIYYNYDTYYVCNYLKEVGHFQERYGFKYDIASIMKDFKDTKFYLHEYSRKFFTFEEIDKTSNISSAYNDIAKGLYESNTDTSLRGALENINKAIELSPNERQLYLNKILILIKMNEIKSVLESINQAINSMDESQIDIVKFDDCENIILSWLGKWNELINSAESNYLIAMFIYEIRLTRLLSSKWDDWCRNSIFRPKNNDGLTQAEKEVKAYISVANEKNNGGYKEFTDTELMYKSLENSCKKSGVCEKKTDSCIYRYKKTEIDKLKKLQNRLDNCDGFCNFDDSTGPDWLGGVETEEEFWEH